MPDVGLAPTTLKALGNLNRLLVSIHFHKRNLSHKYFKCLIRWWGGKSSIRRAILNILTISLPLDFLQLSILELCPKSSLSGSMFLTLAWEHRLSKESRMPLFCDEVEKLILALKVYLQPSINTLS